MAGKYTKAAFIGLAERAGWTFFTTLPASLPLTLDALGGWDWRGMLAVAGLNAALSAVKSAISILGDGNVSTVNAEVVVDNPGDHAAPEV